MEQSTGSLISSSPPLRHMTMHMHPLRALNTPIFAISKLHLKLYTILTMHRHPPSAFYTHYYNIYSLKLLPLTLYQQNIHQKRITIIYIKYLQLQFSTAKKEMMLTQTACDEPSNEHEDGSSGGLEDNLLDRQRRHTSPQRHFTSHFLLLPLDTSPDSQS